MISNERVDIQILINNLYSGAEWRDILPMKMYHGLICQIKEIIDMEFGILDNTGLIIACSDEKRVGQIELVTPKLIESKQQVFVQEGVSFQKVYIKNKLEFITFIKSDSEESLKYLSLISINLANIKVYYDEKFDKNNLIKSIILDNILPGDIPLRAKELHLAYNAYRVAFLIKTDRTKEMHCHEIIQSLFPNKTKDFVIVLDDESTVLIKELKNNSDYKEIDKTSKIIIDTLNTESMVKAVIGIGTIIDNIRDIGRSYKEAQTALLVGSIFDAEKSIINYNNLGLGRLIYQLPPTLCKLFLKEVFNEGTLEALDAETLLTIQKFFENNLNVSETSRQLYVHRNTLVYRLDKIQKITGLDLRKFDDAIIFKVATLVRKYLDKCDKMI